MTAMAGEGQPDLEQVGRVLEVLIEVVGFVETLFRFG